MGYLQGAILEYLRESGPRTNAAIRTAVERDYPVTHSTVNVTLRRMALQQLITKRARGVYGPVAPRFVTDCNRLIVAGVLDRLEQDYGDALIDILQQRGWRRTRGTAPTIKERS